MSIFGKRSGSDKKKKLSKKELKALQERRETERAAELERTYELYRFTIQMTGNIPGLPPLHMDVAHFFRHGFNHKLMTVGELAKLIKERNYVNLTGDQIESILSDAMVMTRYPISLVPRDKCMLTTYVPVSAIAQEKAAMMMDNRYKVLVKRDVMLRGEGPYMDTTFVIKSEEGFENLKAIVDARDDWIISTTDYEFAIDHREGLLLGMHFGWSDAEKLLEYYWDDDSLRDKIAERFRDADFVFFPLLSTLYLFGRGGAVDDEAHSEREKLDRIKKLAKRCAEFLEEMGKPVLRSLKLVDLRLYEIYEYYYLGHDLARRAVIDNPNMIAKNIPDFDPYIKGAQDMIRAEEEEEPSDLITRYRNRSVKPYTRPATAAH